MTRFVIDSPTLVALAQGDQQVDSVHQLVAPNAVRSQALDLLLRSVRDGDLPERTALQIHERLTGIRIRLLGDRVSRRTAWQLAREHDWTTVRDAEYIAVTRLQADALIATDPDLAAKASGLVPLAALSDLLPA